MLQYISYSITVTTLKQYYKYMTLTMKTSNNIISQCIVVVFMAILYFFLLCCCLLLGFKMHQHCKVHLATIQAFTAGGKPQVALRVLLQAKAGTQVEPSTI